LPIYTIEEGTFLVKLAREAVTKYIEESKEIPPPATEFKRLGEKSGVFVTIEKVRDGAKSLRGCIGYPLPRLPLIEATIDSAISAAVNDPRFPPLDAGELNDVVFEVSILTPPALLEPKEQKDCPRLIRVGRDGLIIEQGYYTGLLLPQVATEYGWDEETFLSQCCMKAGLPPDAWLTRGTKIYSFCAEVFAEERPKGKVVPLV